MYYSDPTANEVARLISNGELVSREHFDYYTRQPDFMRLLQIYLFVNEKSKKFHELFNLVCGFNGIIESNGNSKTKASL